MKTIEQKEKAYDEAIYNNYKSFNELIERLESVKNAIKEHNYGIAMDMLCKPYPWFQITTSTELAESEDEKIRKEIIEVIRKEAKEFPSSIIAENASSWIAWLEKQGEQKPVVDTKVFIPRFRVGDIVKSKSQPVFGTRKIISIGIGYYLCEDNGGGISFIWEDDCEIVEKKPADKIEPKFKNDDWITNGIETIQITGYDIDYGYQVNYKGNLQHRDTDIIEKEYHLWIIQNARSGDVLHCWIDGDEFVLIYKGIKDGYITTYGHLYQKLKSFSEEPTSMFCRIIQGHFTPATKEQRDLLFQKMHESGYEWDAEKKELKKIHVIDEGKDEMDYCFTKMMNGEKVSPAWSEEDEKMRTSCVACIGSNYHEGLMTRKEYEHIRDWLASLKEKVQPTPSWGQEDEEKLCEILFLLAKFMGNEDKIEWLYSLKSKIQNTTTLKR